MQGCWPAWGSGCHPASMRQLGPSPAAIVALPLTEADKPVETKKAAALQSLDSPPKDWSIQSGEHCLPLGSSFLDKFLRRRHLQSALQDAHLDPPNFLVFNDAAVAVLVQPLRCKLPHCWLAAADSSEYAAQHEYAAQQVFLLLRRLRCPANVQPAPCTPAPDNPHATAGLPPVRTSQPDAAKLDSPASPATPPPTPPPQPAAAQPAKLATPVKLEQPRTPPSTTPPRCGHCKATFRIRASRACCNVPRHSWSTPSAESLCSASFIHK